MVRLLLKAGAGKNGVLLRMCFSLWMISPLVNILYLFSVPQSNPSKAPWVLQLSMATSWKWWSCSLLEAETDNAPEVVTPGWS